MLLLGYFPFLPQTQTFKKNKTQIWNVSAEEKAKTTVAGASPGRTCLQHPDPAASQILNEIQVRFQIMELHHHQPRFHQHTLQQSQIIIQ